MVSFASASVCAAVLALVCALAPACAYASEWDAVFYEGDIWAGNIIASGVDLTWEDGTDNLNADQQFENVLPDYKRYKLISFQFVGHQTTWYAHNGTQESWDTHRANASRIHLYDSYGVEVSQSIAPIIHYAGKPKDGFGFVCNNLDPDEQYTLVIGAGLEDQMSHDTSSNSFSFTFTVSGLKDKGETPGSDDGQGEGDGDGDGDGGGTGGGGVDPGQDDQGGSGDQPGSSDGQGEQGGNQDPQDPGSSDPDPEDPYQEDPGQSPDPENPGQEENPSKNPADTPTDNPSQNPSQNPSDNGGQQQQGPAAVITPSSNDTTPPTTNTNAASQTAQTQQAETTESTPAATAASSLHKISDAALVNMMTDQQAAQAGGSSSGGGSNDGRSETGYLWLLILIALAALSYGVVRTHGAYLLNLRGSLALDGQAGTKGGIAPGTNLRGLGGRRGSFRS